MAILFIGSQDVGFKTLTHLLEREFDIVGVVSLEPAEHENWTNRIAKLAISEEIPRRVLKDHLLTKQTERDINSPDIVEFIRECAPQLIVVVGWRQIIGEEILSVPKRGTIGVHYSLLPRYRGHAPISWAIINRDEITGLSVFYIARYVDSGDILKTCRIEIGVNDTAHTIRTRLDELAPVAVAEVVKEIFSGTAVREKQDQGKAIVSGYRLPGFSRIDWSQSSRAIFDEVRASAFPYPGAYTYYRDEKLIVWEVEMLPDTPRFMGYAGQILLVRKDEGVIVKTGDHALMVKIVSCGDSGKDSEKVIASKVIKSTREFLGYDAEREICRLKQRLAMEVERTEDLRDRIDRLENLLEQ